MARPKPKLTDEQMRQAETMAGLGMSVEKIAAVLNIPKRTFERMMAADAEISGGLEKARASAEGQITKTAYEMAKSGKVPAMTMFWLKCRARWREVQAVEVSGPDGKPIETKNVGSELLDRLKLLESLRSGKK